MNLVILGSDTRSQNGKGGRSDTIILVHIDTKNDFLSMLSIPRDLRVKIPGHGYNKINAAYAYGGAALLIRTVQSAMGVDLEHYAETDFNGFKVIANALGGVYVDVDRTYDDGKIQLKPGYQLLDGQNALRFCRTRHDKNIDFGRMQRQQRFISAVREQAMGWNLALRLPSLIDSTFDNVDTDLSANEILKLAFWGVKLEGSRMKMASIVTTTGTLDGISFVLATDKQIAKAVKDFLTPPVTDSDTTDLSAQQLTLAAQKLLTQGGRSAPRQLRLAQAGLQGRLRSHGPHVPAAQVRLLLPTQLLHCTGQPGPAGHPGGIPARQEGPVPGCRRHHLARRALGQPGQAGHRGRYSIYRRGHQHQSRSRLVGQGRSALLGREHLDV